MSSHREVAAALGAWRDAERRLEQARGTSRERELADEVERAREEYHALWAAAMGRSLGMSQELRDELEGRPPSGVPDHEESPGEEA